MADLTIKELADELGVSKDKVKYRVRKLPSEFTYKEGNVTYLTKTAVSKIKSEFGGESAEKVPSESPGNLPNEYPAENTDYLKEIIGKKDEQIHQLQEMLKTQQKLVDQQQQLTLQASKQIELLQTQVNELKLPVEVASQDKPLSIETTKEEPEESLAEEKGTPTDKIEKSSKVSETAKTAEEKSVEKEKVSIENVSSEETGTSSETAADELSESNTMTSSKSEAENKPSSVETPQKVEKKAGLWARLFKK
ncbi:hypothetical protein IGI37_000438 [Enterococcus sp. AZ194]|uniref:AsnC family protein n=1 Tax=Enterococcus sp. AZ194 TaxID=2774629 RepID=UPI003F222685